MNEVLTTYLPTALLIIISYATNFFLENHFEANLTVNLSVMFGMTTLFVSVMEKLPRTSYIRMVDIWLIYGQLFPFLEVVLVTFAEYFVVSMNHGGEEDKNFKISTEVVKVHQNVVSISTNKIFQKMNGWPEEVEQDTINEIPSGNSALPMKIKVCNFISKDELSSVFCKICV